MQIEEAQKILRSIANDCGTGIENTEAIESVLSAIHSAQFILDVFNDSDRGVERFSLISKYPEGVVASALSNIFD